MGANQRGVVAEQTIKWALIPQRSGPLVLPEVKLEWFNTNTGAYETALLAEEIIQVAPADAAPIADTPVVDQRPSEAVTATNPDKAWPTPDATGESEVAALTNSGTNAGESGTPITNTLDGSGANALVVDSGLADRLSELQKSAERWRTLALLALLLWLISLIGIAFFRRRLRRTESADLPSPSLPGGRRLMAFAPLAEVEASIRQGQPASVRTALLSWAGRQWSDDPPQTLTALANRLGDDEAGRCISQLDAVLYSRAGAAGSDGSLMQNLRTLPDALKQSAAFANGRGNRSQRATDVSEKGLPVL